MASSSSTSTTLTRFRPAILAVTALAASVGIYYAVQYTRKPHKSSPRPLRRSNAVHRPNPRRRASERSRGTREPLFIDPSETDDPVAFGYRTEDGRTFSGSNVSDENEPLSIVQRNGLDERELDRFQHQRLVYLSYRSILRLMAAGDDGHQLLGSETDPTLAGRAFRQRIGTLDIG